MGTLGQICDTLAHSLGAAVVLPDFFLGDSMSKSVSDLSDATAKGAWIKGQASWGNLKPILDEAVTLLRAEGIASIGVLGWCWGSFVTMHACASGEFSAGCSAHPSHTKLCSLAGENEAEVVGAVNCPQLLLPTQGDPDAVQPGGSNEAIITAKGLLCSVVAFPEMQHGFLSRGDLSDPIVARDVGIALQTIIDFMQVHL